VESKIVLLKDLGPNLPVGFGGTENEIIERPWTMKQERELGGIRDSERNQNVASFVSVVLSHLCSRIGPYDFEAMKEPERRVIVSKTLMPDVYYVYIWLRIQAIGNMLEMDLVCPQCNHSFIFTGDLLSTEVRVPEEGAERTWEYQLVKPFEIRGTKVESLILGPAYWSAIEPVSAGEFNTGEAKAALIRGSIREIPALDGPIALTLDELDDMVKIDIESISSGLEENRLGPDMSIEGKCPKCKREFKTAMDWGYDSFFSVSSRLNR